MSLHAFEKGGCLRILGLVRIAASTASASLLAERRQRSAHAQVRMSSAPYRRRLVIRLDRQHERRRSNEGSFQTADARGGDARAWRLRRSHGERCPRRHQAQPPAPAKGLGRLTGLLPRDHLTEESAIQGDLSKGVRAAPAVQGGGRV